MVQTYITTVLRKNFEDFLGGDSKVETPVTIPNTEAKHFTPKILVWRRTGKIGTAKDYIWKPRVTLGASVIDFVFR